MTNYSENPGMTRFDFFKASGKWYMTLALDMSDFWDEPTVFDAIRKTLTRSGHDRGHFSIVVLQPYHKAAYPVMLVARELVNDR